MFLLDINFDKFIIRLYFFIIFFILAKFEENKRLIVMSSIKYLNFKLCIKNNFIDQIVKNIRFERNLTYILRT